ncbi:MAG: biosynthetic peptidoglycan transglycosylase [Bdellovibrionales bacterium]|jgi:monofunctional biosynthetic peptidoglycan transglycosylase|nr:biosynthetic peptidoglycan transglycosylase [Bdellovibrionales bacterium]
MRRTTPLIWAILIGICTLVLLGGTILLFFITIPDGKDLKGCVTAKMFSVPLCPGTANYVTYAQIAPVMKNAVVVSEDASFWDHEGIDWIELRKSFETNIERGRLARGGSTITQQLAKNVYLSADKSLLRKAREAVIAIRLERQYDKKFLLEKYLNVVEFDKNVYGVRQASTHYFKTHPSQLSVAQAAWLTFLLPNPAKYSVSFHKKQLTPFAYKRMTEIVNRLARFKRISEDERVAALYEVRGLFGGPTSSLPEVKDGLDSDLENGAEDSELYEEESGASEDDSENIPEGTSEEGFEQNDQAE